VAVCTGTKGHNMGMYHSEMWEEGKESCLRNYPQSSPSFILCISAPPKSTSRLPHSYPKEEVETIAIPCVVNRATKQEPL
jgi:hypothetical protein